MVTPPLPNLRIDPRGNRGRSASAIRTLSQSAPWRLARVWVSSLCDRFQGGFQLKERVFFPHLATGKSMLQLGIKSKGGRSQERTNLQEQIAWTQSGEETTLCCSFYLRTSAPSLLGAKTPCCQSLWHGSCAFPRHILRFQSLTSRLVFPQLRSLTHTPLSFSNSSPKRGRQKMCCLCSQCFLLSQLLM